MTCNKSRVAPSSTTLAMTSCRLKVMFWGRLEQLVCFHLHCRLESLFLAISAIFCRHRDACVVPLQAIFSAEGVPSEHEKNKKSNNDDDDYDDEYENEDEYENDDDDDDDDYNSDGFESESPRRRSPKSRTSKASDFNALFRGPGSGHTSPETRIDGKTPQHTTTVMAALLQIPWAEISVLRVALTPRSRSFGTGSKQSVFAATSKFGVTKWLLSALEPVAVNFRGENAKATAIAATVGLVLRQTPFWGGHPTEEPGRSSALPTSATDAVLAALQAQSRLLLLRNRKVLDKVFAARVASAARPVPTEARAIIAVQRIVCGLESCVLLDDLFHTLRLQYDFG